MGGLKATSQMALGLITSGSWRGVPMPSRRVWQYPGLTKLLLKYFRLLAVRQGILDSVDTTLEATTIQLTKNLITRPHKDINNRGPSYITAFGDFEEGGGTLIAHFAGDHVMEVDHADGSFQIPCRLRQVKDVVVEFDGNA